MTQPTPVHPGRPTGCAVCRRPYEPLPGPDAASGPVDGQTRPPVVAAYTPLSASESGAAGATAPGPSNTAHSSQDSQTMCVYLRDRNNDCTVHLTPHARNACYARRRVQQRWWSEVVTLVPSPIDKEHQAQYCFGAYVRCPFFYAPGTTPPSPRVEGTSQKVAA